MPAIGAPGDRWLSAGQSLHSQCSKSSLPSGCSHCTTHRSASVSELGKPHGRSRFSGIGG